MIVFFSNFINEHQIPFCEAMYKSTGGEFTFVATEPVSEERKKLGFSDRTEEFPFVLATYKSEENLKKARELGKNSDVVIIGSAPDEFIEERLRENKITFRYSERYFKEGRWHILSPRAFLAYYKRDFKNRKKNLYMLCASAYTASDCRFIHSYPNKTYKWGYFSPIDKHDDIDKLIENKEYNTIVWTGRFIDWKHPEIPLYIANKLKKSGYNFVLNIVGGGDLQEKLTSIITKYNLEDVVKLHGTMSPEKVRQEMSKNEIFLFTSDRNEGWGAVLNESMNGACAVVASSAIGSVPYLIKDGENGLIYKDGNLKDLYKKVKYLIDNPEKRKDMGRKAYETLVTKWNANVAAKRLLTLIDKLKNGEDTPYKDGPCSRD